MKKISLALMLALLVSVPALASTAPTSAEKREITAVLLEYVDGSTAVDPDTAKVRAIRLSGTYARARVSAPSTDTATAILRKRRGGWRLLDFGTSLSCRGVPDRVRTDLNLPCGG